MSHKLGDIRSSRYTKWTIPHGFFPGSVEGRNLSVGYESTKTYLENRHTIVLSMGMDPVKAIFPYQVHGGNVCIIEKQMPSVLPTCDGLVTAIPGVTLGISTADCAPVLFWDGADVVGICHAGWKGTRAGILEHTLETVQSISKTDKKIQACIGPTIRSHHYEVSYDFYNLFVKEDAKSSQFFKEQGFLSFDLPGYVKFRLMQKNCVVFDTLEDTFESSFVSRRQSRHQGLLSNHSFGSLIGIRKTD
ncbi:polyphenol oxidase family protein [Holospora curviuscula]|uniref:Laccase domain protein YfiH n=1 Tax=Holospora curviuscula TaxID=1082868 RepID=A0A2S5RHR5_9PROT|nr:polyphenol oxidase family protein [Holospora curviuscula]PPE06874.1 Laccase domain protein YfiH [Holospora curviuscula]